MKNNAALSEMKYSSSISNVIQLDSDISKVKEFQKYEIKIRKEDGEQSLVIAKPSFTIGRSHGAEVSIQHELVSREHLKITMKGQEILIEEMGSSNGTWINGNQLVPKKLYAYTDSAQITIGKTGGPIVSIKCIFVQKDDFNEKTQSTLRPNITSSAPHDEDSTLVRKNPLLDEKKTESNVIALQTKALKQNAIRESVHPMVSNGHYESIGETLTTHTGVKPNLLAKMKNMLDSEVEKAKKQSKDEAEEIRNVSLKEANDLVSSAREEAYKLKAVAEEEVFKIRANCSAEIDKIKAANLRESTALLEQARRESEEMILSASQEAADIRQSAQKFSDDTTSKAREKSSKLTKDTEINVQRRLKECKIAEEENSQKILEANTHHLELKNKVEELKLMERSAQANYESLSKSIKNEEQRIQDERNSLENLKVELAISKKEAEQRIMDLKYEERNVRAELETAILENKLLITQAQTEIKQIEVVKETLGQDIFSLKNEKEKIEKQIKDVEADLLDETQRVKDAEVARDVALAETQRTKEEHLKLLADIEKEKSDIKSAYEDLTLREKESAERVYQSDIMAAETTERIKKETQSFDTKKAEMLLEFQEEKRQQHKIIKDEIQLQRALQVEELQKLKDQHAKILKAAEKSHLESLKNLEQTIKKSKEEFQAFQKALKDDTEKMRADSHVQAAQAKSKVEIVTNQMNKEHQEMRKAMTFELESMDSIKKRLEQDIKSLESSRKEKMARVDSEAKEILAETKKKADLMMSRVEAEVEKQRLSLEETKEKELAEIEELKKVAQKEIFGKKAERAKDVVTNVGGVLLTQLNSLRNQKLSDELIEACSNEINEMVFNTVMGTISADKLKLEAATKARVRAKKKWNKLKNRINKTFMIFALAVFLVMLPKMMTTPEFAMIKKLFETEVIANIHKLLNP